MNRSFKTFFAAGQLPSYQAGTFRYRYRGVPCLKSPIDIAIYLSLIHEAKPRTIVEIGSKHGGSALMFRDFMELAGAEGNVVSIDLQRPDLSVPGVRFMEGDILRLPEVLRDDFLDELPRPWLVVEDSAHTFEACTSALGFFAGRLMPGEWLTIEDGVLDELGLDSKYDGGPNRAISQFFQRYPDAYSVSARHCDMFGANATYNPNGYLQRTAAPFREAGDA